MAKFANEATQGYPTGDATKSTYWPNSPLPSATANLHGVPNSPDEYPHKTWEAKAAATIPPGTFATVVNGGFSMESDDSLDLALDEPYPTGCPWQSREDLLKSIHSPMELVEAKDWAGQHERNLRAGGSVEMKDVKISV